MLTPVLFLAMLVSAHPGVDQARTAYDEGDFQAALTSLARAESDPALSREDRVSLHWWKAATLLALKQGGDADASFDALLALDPMYQPSVMDASPAIEQAFSRRKERYQKAHGVTLGAPALLGAQLSVPVSGHPAEVAGGVVFARVPGDAAFRTFPLAVKEGAVDGVISDESIWSRAMEKGALELVLEAHNEKGGVVARSGNPGAPLRIPVDRGAAMDAVRMAQAMPHERAPLWRSTRMPWIAAAGSVGVMGGVAGVVALSGALASSLGYGLMWMHPRTTGADASLSYQALVTSWLGGGLVAVAAGLTCAALLASGMGVLLVAMLVE